MDTAAIERLMRAGAFGEARDALQAHLQGAPDDPRALYLLAVVHRYSRTYEAAEQTLRRARQAAPDDGRIRQEQGHLLRTLGRDAEAIDAFRLACRFDPTLLGSWRALVDLLRTHGHREEAAAAAAELQRLERLPGPLLGTMALIRQGRLGKAETLCRQFLQQHPKHVEGMRLLADIALRLGVLEEGEFLLESAVTFEPENLAARIDYIGALRKRQKFTRAREEAKRLLDSDPTSPRFQSLHAVECLQTGDYDAALAGFARVLERLPRDPITLTSRGHALKTRGATEDAIESYRAAIEARPAHGEAWYSLANLKTYRFDEADMQRMAAIVADPELDSQNQAWLHFALGKAFEDAQRWEDAFRHYAAGNDIKRRQSRYDADRVHEDFEAQKRICTLAFFAERAGVGCDAPDPIFIVGLPRAGSTLLEQILSSHSQIDGTLELPNVLSLAQRLRRRGYPQCLAELTGDELAAFGQEYLDDTRIHRQGAPFFLDKMPNNFRHLGLIHLMLPNARIIDARRNPMACCFSGFKQLFAEGQEFSYSLETLGRYYRDYVSLMDHWHAVLPAGRLLQVNHEAVVDDLPGQVARMLTFLELPHEDACLRYWETERAVRTPSSEQVRQPIFREGTAQWMHFSRWLGPLEIALGDVLQRA